MSEAFTGPSLTDLASEEAFVQAKYELNRATDRHDDAALAAWAKKWGESALNASRGRADEDESDAASLERAEEDFQESPGAAREVLVKSVKTMRELSKAEGITEEASIALGDAADDLQDLIGEMRYL